MSECLIFTSPLTLPHPRPQISQSVSHRFVFGIRCFGRLLARWRWRSLALAGAPSADCPLVGGHALKISHHARPQFALLAPPSVRPYVHTLPPPHSLTHSNERTNERTNKRTTRHYVSRSLSEPINQSPPSLARGGWLALAGALYAIVTLTWGE